MTKPKREAPEAGVLVNVRFTKDYKWRRAESEGYLASDGESLYARCLGKQPRAWPEWKISMQKKVKKVQDENVVQDEKQMHEKGDLTKDEADIINHLVLVWNQFTEFPVQHPADISEFQSSINNLQRLIGVRVLRRDYPDRWFSQKAKA